MPERLLRRKGATQGLRRRKNGSCGADQGGRHIAFAAAANPRIRRSAAEPQCDTPSPPSDGGEGQGEEVATPLLDPLPTPSSWGEEKELAQERIGATRDDLDRY